MDHITTENKLTRPPQFPEDESHQTKMKCCYACLCVNVITTEDVQYDIKFAHFYVVSSTVHVADEFI